MNMNMKKSFDNAGSRRRSSPAQRRTLGCYRYVRLHWRILFAVVDWLGCLAARLVAHLMHSGTPEAERAGPVESILLVQLDHIGDALITAVVLPALKARFPGARIDVLAAQWNREVFAACPEIDRIHVSRVNRFARGLRRHAWLASALWWGWKLRRYRYDLAIDVRGEFPHVLIVWLAGARRRLGWDCGGGGFLLTERARFSPDRPEVQARLALLARVGVDAPDVLAGGPWFNPPSGAARRVYGLLVEAGGLTKPWFVMHLGAGTEAKRWPVEHWRELLGRVILEYGARVAIVGGPGETPLVRAVTQGLDWPGVVDFTGRLSLVETAALIQAARVFIGGDSGPAHLAASVATPAVVLFSGTNSASQWRPWGARVAVVRHDVPCSPCHRHRCPWIEHPCMSGISPLDVMACIESLVGPPATTLPQPAPAGPAARSALAAELAKLARSPA